MNKQFTIGKIIAIVVIVIAAVVVIWKFSTPAPQTGTQTGTNAPTSTVTAAAPGASNPATTTKAGGTTVKSSIQNPNPIIFVTPIPGETWTFATQNIIQWSRAAGTTGRIELLDATTKAYVGEILANTGPNQSSYTWNTRDISLSRTNSLKKDVAPGRYVIRIEFDQLHLPAMTSQPITIVK